MRCAIFSGGPIKSYEKMSLGPFDLLICADSGIRHAAALGLIPHYIVGDLDSAEPELLEEFQQKGSKIFNFSRDKDEVDTELALQIAIALKPEEIVIYGGLGDRLDHTLANIHLLSMPACRGISVFLVDHRHRISLVTAQGSGLVRGQGVTFSLLPLTDKVKGAKVKGALWELEGAEFAMGKPYGVSNKVIADYAEISVQEGMLLLYELFYV